MPAIEIGAFLRQSAPRHVGLEALRARSARRGGVSASSAART